MPPKKPGKRSDRRAARYAAVSCLRNILTPSDQGTAAHVIDQGSQDAGNDASLSGINTMEIDESSLSEEEECEQVGRSSVTSEQHSDNHSETAEDLGSDPQSVVSDSSSSDEGRDEDENLVLLLVSWSARHNITLTALDSLLFILRPFHPNLPRCAKTVMHTPSTKTALKVLANGHYAHRGLFKGLASRLKGGIRAGCTNIKVDINVDGLSVFKNSPEEAWSILGRCTNFLDSRPFIIGMFYGVGKPEPLSEYLQDFITEAKDLQIRGLLINGQKYDVIIHNFICDAPARAYLKCVKGHTSAYGCERCDQEGYHDGRQEVFLTRSGTLRTDESFRDKTDPDHHHLGRVSPLESDLGLKCITQIVLEIMHLRDLGACSRFFEFIVGRAPPIARMSAEDCRATSQLLLSVGPFIPSEFTRKPRIIKDMPRWKATELRLLLLYVGVIVLQPALREEVYKLFLLLHCSMYILSSSDLIEDHLENAQTFIEQFVRYSAQLFGPEFVSYNIHSLLHLPNEVKKHGNPEKFLSAYPFEDYNQTIKSLVRSKARPLQQIMRRLEEKEHFSQKVITRKHEEGLFQPYCGGPLAGLVEVTEYKKYVGGSFQIRLTKNDSAFLFPGNQVGQVCNIVKQGASVKLICQLFKSYDNFYDYPLPSRELGISLVSGLDQSYRIYDLGDVKTKCMLLPHGDKFVAFPILHTC